jgi:hypothetical protein
MFRRWRHRRLEGSTSAEGDEHVTAVVADAMSCAAELQSLGEQIDAFRRRGGAAIGGELGPEVGILQGQHSELVRAFLERTGRVREEDRASVEAACRRLEELNRDPHQRLVTGRALALVEAVLRQDDP